MWRTVTSTALIALYCAGCAAVDRAPAKTPGNARLVEAQRAQEEGERLLAAGRYAEAVPLVERALKVREEVLGGAHAEVADCLFVLGALRRQQGDYKRAEPLLERALTIWEAALGPSHPSVASALNGLGELHRQQGDHKRAEPLLERALALWQTALGPSHPSVAGALNSLAALHQEQGRYAQAEPLHQRALAIREAALGPRHADVAESLNNLALLYQLQGQYARAEPLYERSLSIRETTLGPRHARLATSLNNLAGLYQDRGQYARAEPLYERALAIREAALGPVHPEVAILLNNLAMLYQEQAQYARAETLHERALAIREAALGPVHPEAAMTLNNLAMLYQKQGQYARAQPLYERALAILEATQRPNHPSIATPLNNLALLHQEQGQYARAEPLYERALAIVEAALGSGHPKVAHVLNNLARLRLGQERLHEAMTLFERATALLEEHLRMQVLVLSEERLASFLQQRRIEEGRIYSLVRAHPGDSRARRLALATSLLRKGRSVEELANVSRTIYRGLGVDDRGAFEQLSALRTELTSLSLAGPGRRAPADYHQRLKELAEQAEALETSLARRSAPLRALRALPSPEQIVDRVAGALPKGGALVEFIAYQDRPLVPAPGTPPDQVPAEPRYLALLLFEDGRTGAVDLGPAALMDQAIDRLRSAFAGQAAAWQPAARELYRLAFRPLLPVLGKTRRLLLAPDGQLALVPFDALYDGRRLLIDGFDLAYLNSGKDLLPRPEGMTLSSSVTVFADPDLSARPAAATMRGSPAERSPAVEQFFSTRCNGAANLAWRPLPDTRQEAESIQRLLPQARLLLGGEATKEALLQVKAPGILHIATHGFFLEDVGSAEGNRGVVTGLGEAGPALCPADPLLRSGLVLAGAQAAEQRQGPPRREDSLVTALELAGVDLWGTQLVVLSACDTGRGEVTPGQGVYGLRRALEVAGAETVVMSLWKVNDETTRQLMEAYYRHLLAGKGRTGALREAMRALRKVHPHPYHWAPFLSVGQQAPLRGLGPAAPL